MNRNVESSAVSTHTMRFRRHCRLSSAYFVFVALPILGTTAGLITNDVHLTRQQGDMGPKPLYAALLTSNGRVIYDMVIHRMSAGVAESGAAILQEEDANEVYYLDVDATSGCLARRRV